MNGAWPHWRKSSYSEPETECVEVAFLPTPWRSSSYSGSQGECVEVAYTPDEVGIRDSKNRPGGTVLFSEQAWRIFTTALRSAPS